MYLSRFLKLALVCWLCMVGRQSHGQAPNTDPQIFPNHYPTVFRDDQNTNLPGYTLVSFDEFNGSSSNIHFISRNNQRHGPCGLETGYFQSNNVEFDPAYQDLSEGVDGALKLWVRKLSQPITGFDCSNDPNTQLDYQFSCAHVRVRPSPTQLYEPGYFEIRAKLPKMQGTWPGFWFFEGEPLPGQSQEYQQELDVFEMHPSNAGCDLNLTNFHIPTGPLDLIDDQSATDVICSSTEYEDELFPAATILGVPVIGEDFTETYYTFGFSYKDKTMKWYLNDRLIRYSRINTCYGDLIDQEMILTNLIPWFEPYLPNGGAPESGAMTVDYVRAYEYTSDAHLNLRGNNQTSTYDANTQAWSPIEMYLDNPFYLDNFLSYSPTDKYSLTITTANSVGATTTPSGLPFGLSHAETLSIKDNASLMFGDLDLQKFAERAEFDLVPGSYYLLTLTAEQTNKQAKLLVHVNPCSDQGAFKINGQVAPTVQLDHDEELLLDLREVRTCNGMVFLEVCEMSNGTCSNSYQKWFAQADLAPASGFDLRELLDTEEYALEGGKTYRIGIEGGGGSWNPSYLQFQLNCQDEANFLVNGRPIPSQGTPLVNVSLSEGVFINAAATRACGDEVFLEVLDGVGNSFTQLYTLSEGELNNFDVGTILQGFGTFTSNSWYLVRLYIGDQADLNLLHQSALLFTTPCPSNYPKAQLRVSPKPKDGGSHDMWASNHVVSFEDAALHLFISGAGSRSCSGKFQWKIERKLSPFSPYFPLLEETLSPGDYQHTNTLRLKLADEVSIVPGNYRITLRALAENGNADAQDIAYITVQNPNKNAGSALEAISEHEAPSSLVFPNPSTGKVTLAWDLDALEVQEYTVADAQGKIILSHSAGLTGKELFDLSDQPRGLYFVRLSTSQGYQTHKLILR